MPDHVTGRIGPNAIIRTEEAIRALEGPRMVERIFHEAGLDDYLERPPSDMLDEKEVAALHDAVRETLGCERARTVGWISGQRTADYLLRHRIPHAAQLAMKGMIPGLASRFLTAAMARNAWTFAGTGKFSVKHGNGATLTLRGCPICRGGQTVEPCCDYYAGTFERLYARLVHADARVAETACEAGGAEACVFSVRW